MIVCRKCSRRHVDGTDFCVCGAFLEFDGEHVPDDLPAPGAPAPAPPAPTRSAPPAPPATPATPDDNWSSGPATARPAAEPAPWSGFEPAAPAEPEPSWGSVRAQLPDAPVAPVGHDTVEVRPTMRTGDVVCTTCGTPNPPTRQFCQKCGSPLSAVAAPVSTGRGDRQKGPSWWSRTRRSARRKGLDSRRLATEAHMLSRGGLSGRSVLFRTGGVVVLLGGLLAFLGPWQGTVRGWARDRLGTSRFDLIDLEPEQATSEAAGAAPPAEFPLQGPDKLVDRHMNTSWATRWLDPVGQGLDAVPDDDACQTTEHTDSFLRVTFAEPTDLGQFSIIAGRYDGDETRGTFFRPRVVELRWGDDQCSYVELPDTGELSVHSFEHDDVEAVDVRVVGVYADTESQPVVDISEVVFEKDR